MLCWIILDSRAINLQEVELVGNPTHRIRHKLSWTRYSNTTKETFDILNKRHTTLTLKFLGKKGLTLPICRRLQEDLGPSKAPKLNEALYLRITTSTTMLDEKFATSCHSLRGEVYTPAYTIYGNSYKEWLNTFPTCDTTYWTKPIYSVLRSSSHYS